MSSLTCLACNVGFEDVDLGRFHYKSDWHRYNLKRKVANLFPITLEQFEERQIQAKKNSANTNAQDLCFCKPCNKTFSTSNAYENHVQSKKHKNVVSGSQKQQKKKHVPSKIDASSLKESAVADVPDSEEIMDNDDDSDVESWDSFDENTIGLEECLFCSYVSGSMEQNIEHMTTKHGFFIPHAEYISDLEGLVQYLGEKVGAGHMCLWCNEKGKRFHTTKDVQRHMVDKCHCKMLYEGDALLEFADFYDYSSSYPDGQDPEVNPDDTVSPAELESDGYSLTLPSGATIGHRILMRYYQQNLVPHMNDSRRKMLPKMLAHYKALGWTGTSGPQVQQTMKDLKYVQRLKNKYYVQLGCSQNSVQKLRFRNPNGP